MNQNFNFATPMEILNTFWLRISHSGHFWDGLMLNFLNNNGGPQHFLVEILSLWSSWYFHQSPRWKTFSQKWQCLWKILTCGRRMFDRWTNDMWYVDEWHLTRGRLTRDMWTKDIWHVDEWYLTCARVTYDMWTNDIWHVNEWYLIYRQMILTRGRKTFDRWMSDV